MMRLLDLLLDAAWCYASRIPGFSDSPAGHSAAPLLCGAAGESDHIGDGNKMVEGAT
jgi:hypothetical protein